MAKVLLVTIVVTLLAHHRSSGTYCRFANTSASQGSCIFPCRCTDGCSTTTGDCLNSGQCGVGHPSVATWSGTACQTGNVAFGKNASQSIVNGVADFPAGRAVDGDTNPDMSEGHCAHPDTAKGSNAWWMVDLGGTYNIYKVIVYTRGDSSVELLDSFILRVGNSSDRGMHSGCASHYRPMAAGEAVAKTCTVVARYLSFWRDEQFRSNATGLPLCEVVVIGHRHISCQNCPSTSTCNVVIGCTACTPGKQQPDCVEVCDIGTYGTNCKEHCGQCKDNQQCDIKTGQCPSGCETWYTSNLCKSHIRRPYFPQSYKPEVGSITSSAVIVSWQQAKYIPTGFETHYYYVVWLQKGEETLNNVSRISQTAGLGRLQSHIDGLAFNTNYSVKIDAYRQQNETVDRGHSTQLRRFKTSCIAPDSPIMQHLAASTHDGTLVVTWKPPKKSGCDELVAVSVLYKRQMSEHDEWLYKEAPQVTSTQLTITDLSSGLYDVKVRAANNEGITSTSDSQTSGSTSPSTLSSVGRGAPFVSGVSVSAIVIIVVVCVVVFIIIRRRRAERNKNTTSNIQVTFSARVQQDDGEANAGFETGQAAGDWESREVNVNRQSMPPRVAGP